MHRTSGRRITSAHVMAAIALFVSLGSGAWAAVTLPNNSVGTKQLKNAAVTSQKVKNGAINRFKIANGAVGTFKLANGAVTRTKLAGASVGQSQLDPSNITSFVQGNGQLQSMAATVGATGLLSTPPVLADVPGFGQVKLLYCSPKASNYVVRIQVVSDNNAAPFLHVAQGWGANAPPGTPQAAFIDGSSGTLSSGGGSLVTAQGTNTSIGLSATFQVLMSRGTGSAVTGAHTTVGVDNNGTTCSATAQTIIQK
jgi:hypothetical protein